MSTLLRPVTYVELIVNANHKKTGLKRLSHDMDRIRRSQLTFVAFVLARYCLSISDSSRLLYGTYLSAINISLYPHAVPEFHDLRKILFLRFPRR